MDYNYLNGLKQITNSQNNAQSAHDSNDISKNLKWLRNLKLSESDIKKILDEPNERKENEDIKRYKLRRKIRNVLVKYKNII